VLRVVPEGDLRQVALEVAGVIADKDPAVVRAAKASLNGIDPVDVSRSYRCEQGFTFELNLMGSGEAAREAFLRGDRGPNAAAD
jgi:enoyl-CoA hydratase